MSVEMNTDVSSHGLCLPVALSASGPNRNMGQPLLASLIRLWESEPGRAVPVRLSDEIYDVWLNSCSTSSTGDGMEPVFEPDLRTQYLSELAAKESEARRTFQAYRLRIEALHNDAALDGFAVNEASREDFWSFVGSLFHAQKAGLVLMDNGNLRAVWKGANGSHVGLQFLGGRTIEYVIFKRRQAARDISRVAGRDTLDGIKKQLLAFDLTAMMGL